MFPVVILSLLAEFSPEDSEDIGSILCWKLTTF